jgi:phosphoserine phosphatase
MLAGQVLVLTAETGVPDAVADEVAVALDAAGARPGPPRRLAASAVEFGLGSPPETLEARALVDGRAIDANIVPAAGRRKKLLIADMDSTIIGVECIDELADFAGVKDRVAGITDRAMRGELNFEAALLERVGLLKGLPEADLEACYAARVKLNPGARVLVQTMAALGAQTALVSGGFNFFTARVAAAAGFARNQANALLVVEGRLSGDVGRPILGREAKLAALQDLAVEAGIGLEESIAVGDGANDLDMVAAAGLGVAYRAKPALAAAADARLEHSDLTALLALQGIGEADWRD